MNIEKALEVATLVEERRIYMNIIEELKLSCGLYSKKDDSSMSFVSLDTVLTEGSKQVINDYYCEELIKCEAKIGEL